jgi:DNA-directed RNA polymerase subunit RPC12/RpoP
MVVMLGITLAAALYVAWPLLFGQVRPEEFLGSEPGEPVLQRLLFQRDTVYAAMKELDFDLAMGNLSQEDFQQLQDRYKRKAVAILKRIDDAKAGRLRHDDVPEARDDFLADTAYAHRPVAHEGADETELDVEQEIQSFRKSVRERDGRGTPPPSARASRPITCPNCGHRIRDPKAAFCSKCGAPIRRQQQGSSG